MLSTLLRPGSHNPSKLPLFGTSHLNLNDIRIFYTLSNINMRSSIVFSPLTFIPLAFTSPAPYTIETTTSATLTTTDSGAFVPTPASLAADGALLAAADDDATTIITLASAQTVLISVPGNEPYTAIPEQGYVQVQVAVHVSVVVDYSDPSSTVSTITQTQTIERRVDFCTTISTIGIS